MATLTAEAHIFRIAASSFRASFLSPDEQERAARFRFDEHRQTYTAARSSLRMILGRYLACDPLEIQFNIGNHGKPSILKPVSNSPLHFNVSHSNGFAVIGVTEVAPIGVDLERIRRDIAETDIAKRYFSKREQQWLQACSEGERKRDFFRLWVLKEAIIKADGRGLSMPLSAAEIEFMDDEPRVASGEWWVQELQLLPDFASAVACGRQCRLLIMDS